MKKITSLLFALLFCSLLSPTLQAQNNNFLQQFNRHFDYASRVLSLAKAIPADTYSWRPQEGVRSVEEIFTHIARYNYYYLESSLDIPAPDNVDVENLESETGKQNVVAILERSIKHVKSTMQNMPASKLSETTELYGQQVNGQAVLMQLITHYSEHVGQAIAYARMNEIVPPWNQ